MIGISSLSGLLLSSIVLAAVLVYGYTLAKGMRVHGGKDSQKNQTSNGTERRTGSEVQCGDSKQMVDPAGEGEGPVEVVHLGVALLAAERRGAGTLLTLLYSDKTSSQTLTWEDQRSASGQSGAGVLEWSLPGQWSPRALMEAAGDCTSGVLQVTTLPGGKTFSELRLASLHIKSQN